MAAIRAAGSGVATTVGVGIGAGEAVPWDADGAAGDEVDEDAGPGEGGDDADAVDDPGVGAGPGEHAARNAATPPAAAPRSRVRREIVAGTNRTSIAREPTPARPIRP
jgi:hypothetical protein